MFTQREIIGGLSGILIGIAVTLAALSSHDGFHNYLITYNYGGENTGFHSEIYHSKTLTEAEMVQFAETVKTKDQTNINILAAIKLDDDKPALGKDY